jgi:aldehyde:ferredoxin oxidoreductase
MSYAGKYLQINLSTQKVEVKTIAEDDLQNFYLGSGYAALLYYRDMDPTIDALDERSTLYIFNGLVTGSMIPTACRTSFCGRSPLTNIWNESNVGGHFGAELRKAGWDGITITGKAHQPVYLYIEDQNVEIRDAQGLWGLDTFDTFDRLIENTNPKARAVSIGPAGENLLMFASIIQGGRDHCRAVGRGGMGAIFGSKNLKAISVFGTEKVAVHNPDGLRSLVREQNQVIRKKSEGLSKFGTAGGVSGTEASGDLPVHNYQKGSWTEGAKAINGQTLAEGHQVKRTFCFSCPIGCGKHVTTDLSNGTHIHGAAPEYETLAGMGAMLEIDDLETMLKANDFCNRMGMDTISASTSAAFAFEAFENGLISLEECDNHPLSWGDPESLMVILNLILNQRGCGEILAQGTRKAAEFYQQGSSNYAMHVKGLELAYHDPRATFSMAANYATANRGGCHLEGLSYWTLYGLDGSSWSPKKADRFSNEDAAQEAVAFQDYFSVYNPIGICKFIGKTGISPDVIAKMVNEATGWELVGQDILIAGKRIFNLKRMINNRLGITHADDDLPERLKTLARPDGGAAGKLPDMPKILSNYYQLRGWDADGRPGETTKQKLSLDQLNKD